MITNKKLEDMAKTAPKGCEIYQVGNQNSQHDIDIVLVYGNCSLTEKISKEIEIRDYFQSIFGKDAYMFKDSKFDDFTQEMSVHALTYGDPIKEESPFMIRGYFSDYRCLAGEDRGEEYRLLATEKIRKEPHRAKQYINRAMSYFIDTYTEPYTPLQIMNRLINANKFAVRTIKNLNEVYPDRITYNKNELSDISKLIKKTVSEVHGKGLTPEEIAHQVDLQKSISHNLLGRLEEISKKIREN